MEHRVPDTEHCSPFSAGPRSPDIALCFTCHPPVSSAGQRQAFSALLRSHSQHKAWPCTSQAKQKPPESPPPPFLAAKPLNPHLSSCLLLCWNSTPFTGLVQPISSELGAVPPLSSGAISIHPLFSHALKAPRIRTKQCSNLSLTKNESFSHGPKDRAIPILALEPQRIGECRGGAVPLPGHSREENLPFGVRLVAGRGGGAHTRFK